MAEPVYIPLGITEIEEAKELPSKTYRLDLDKGRIVGKVDRLEAVNQAIRKAIITPRFKCLIYDNNYGSEIEDAVIAKDASRKYVEAVVPGFIEDCLRPDTRILRVYGFEFEFGDETAHIKFKADTIYGETEIEEVI